MTMEKGVKKDPPKSKSTYSLFVYTIIILCVAAAIGVILWYALPSNRPELRTDTVADCIPEGIHDEELCEQRGCTWQNPDDGAPWCTFPAGYGYVIYGDLEHTELGFNLLLTRQDHPSLFGDDLETIKVTVEYHSDYRVRIKFSDPEEERYTVPEEAVHITQPEAAADPLNTLYNVTVEDTPSFGIKITRKDTGSVVFDSSVPGLVFSEQYIQLTTRLASQYVYGFGEHRHDTLMHDMEWRKWGLFTRHAPPSGYWNLYGAHPMHLNLEEDGNANGVLLLNSNAMDVETQPKPFPGISYHVTGGILDFYIFLGPSPENVIQQYTEAVGRPMMPPYWALGFHLGRLDYDNATHVRDVMERNWQAGIPVESLFADADYMESNLGFTYDTDKYSDLPALVTDLHSRGQRYMIVLDNSIGNNESIIDSTMTGAYKPLDEGLAADVFIQDTREDIELLEGKARPTSCFYPDFSLPQTQQWWTNQSSEFHNIIPFDGVWVDMNEPANKVAGSTFGCEQNKWNNPPYIPNILDLEDTDGLYDGTICMDTKISDTEHYNAHNLYGHTMAAAAAETQEVIKPQERPLVVTRSQFVGTGRKAGHWLGDNRSDWEDIPTSIIGMLEYSLFGFSYTGANICGYTYDTTEKMCQRWMQLGAFYPFARNHNGAGWKDQDPAAFSDEMIRVSRDILSTRYKLLPFLYTLMYEAHVRGSTVARPLYHEFPAVSRVREIDQQFLWGPSFMISPVVDKDQVYVDVYFPEDRWYQYYGGKEITPTGKAHNFTTPVDQLQLHVRGGYVIPWQLAAMTTSESRENAMGLIVAIGQPPYYKVEGSLFWDDGISKDSITSGNYLLVDFTGEENNMHMNVVNDYDTSLQFKTIQIWGLNRRPMEVTIDDVEISWSQILYDSFSKATTLVNLNLDINQNHTLSWTTPY